MKFTPQLSEEYSRLFASAKAKPWAVEECAAIVGKIMDPEARSRYEEIERATKVPWRVVAIIHYMECSLSFERHLHNGDPLTAKTRQVPKGRPHGPPPFSFEASAMDALDYDGFTGWQDWSVPGILFKLEGYNGWGYRRKQINTPYLWSGCQHYVRGKYVADGVWSASAVSKQLGTALLLKALMP